MQQLGTQNETEQVATFFKHLKITKERFAEEDALAVLLTFYAYIGNEDIGEAPAKITYNGTDYFAHFQAIQVEGYKTLKEGAAVAFEPGDGEKGPVAKTIVNA